MKRAHRAGEAAGGPLDFKTDLAIWTAVVFLVLFAVLFKFAWGPISEGLHKREQGIADNISAAQRQHDEAKALLAEYDQKMAKAAGEVRQIMEEARRDAEHTQQEMLAQARQEAEATKQRALLEIETATEQALQSLAERGADLAVELAGKIVRSQLNASDHAALIQDAVAHFAQAKPSEN